MYWRRRLPHWTPDGAEIFLTWRLAGTKPGSTSGPQWLSQPHIAMIFVEALVHGESVRRFYDLHAWVVMPNHVHVVTKPNRPLPADMRWLKTATANRANRLLGQREAHFGRGNIMIVGFDRTSNSHRQSQFEAG
jgi:hypothetical protein